MSAFLDLIDRGIAQITAATPCTLVVLPTAAELEEDEDAEGASYVGTKSAVEVVEDMRAGYTLQKISCGAVFRRTIMAAAPAEGRKATLDGVAVRVANYTEDETGFEVFFSQRSK